MISKAHADETNVTLIYLLIDPGKRRVLHPLMVL